MRYGHFLFTIQFKKSPSSLFSSKIFEAEKISDIAYSEELGEKGKGRGTLSNVSTLTENTTAVMCYSP